MTISAAWVDHIKDWENSNLTQKDYCHQHGLSYNSFVYWRGLLKQNKKAADFLTKSPPVLPAFSAMPSQIGINPTKAGDKFSCLEISLPHGITLKIPLPC